MEEAAVARVHAEMKVLVLERLVLAKYGADHSDPKYPQYKQLLVVAQGEVQTKRNDGSRAALAQHYLSNPDDLTALLDI